MSARTRRCAAMWTSRISGTWPRSWLVRAGAISPARCRTSALGLARAQLDDEAVGGVILALQQDLYLLMAELATPPEHYERLGFRVTAEHLAKIDGVLEDFRARTRIGHQFIIPGASVGGA